MEYKLRELELKDHSKILLIDLPEPYKNFSSLLEDDVRSYDNWLIQQIEDVISGKSPEEEIAGNSGTLVIKPNICIFYAVFDEDDSQGCIMKTMDLYEIVKIWKKSLQLYKDGQLVL